MRDPETLRQVAEPGAECEDILYAAQEAFARRTGRDMPVRKPIPRQLKGAEWREEDLQDMFPLLFAAFVGR